MCTEATAERILEAVRKLPEEEALEVLDFAEFLKARRQREDQEDVKEAKEVLQRIDRGEEETIPWDGVKGEYGLQTLPTVSAFQGEPVEIQETLRREWD